MVRLSSARTALLSGDAIQDLHYLYDPGGNPISIASTLPVPAPGSHLPGPGDWRFDYDGVDRLTFAHGDQVETPGKVNAYDAHFEYSPIHNLTHRDRAHTMYPFTGVVA
jgi:hypothetical protein